MIEKETAVSRWIIRANADLKTCNILSKSRGSAPEIICFHAQQCVEKYLKAFLVHVNIKFPRTHDLNQLIQLCINQDATFNELQTMTKELNAYAVTVRYPDAWCEISREDSSNAVKMATYIRKFLKTKIK